MKNKTVKITVADGLCISCGICKGSCPVGCIEMCENSGMYEPVIDNEKCIECSICADVCPGLSFEYKPKETLEKTVVGPVVATYNGWSRNADIRHVSASGGVITSFVKELLLKKEYDGVFCLDSYNYNGHLKTVYYDADSFFDSIEKGTSPKSRYLPVSHGDAVSYVKNNKDSRVILIGTSCAVRGILRVIERFSLNRENYLIIGLFCDKVFNYNVIRFFENKFCDGEHIRSLHFKNKNSGGWPGDMRFETETGRSFYIPLSERAKTKKYFMPERCLYCVDKLNSAADISLGDNYTGKDSSSLGSNSIIIRTPKGQRAWATASFNIETGNVNISDITEAQCVSERLKNLSFAGLKEKRSLYDHELNRGLEVDDDLKQCESEYKRCIRRIYAGRAYIGNEKKLYRLIKKDEKRSNPRSLSNIIIRGKGYLKRKLNRT